ncbi:PREDICTED: LOB domain-containing protein 6-like [Camelina sativa]|uniref:LOB domain-containing protein 6-like n=1 Tax=Camelina sativa TaxID=90675 RepID=A0ABM1RSB1_CAMSA|nr:PREDICTED: LOB domain-containing protein 6-like [Camelina sativa]
MELCACKDVRHKSIEECVFAPYLPANKPEKYATLCKEFDISKLAKHLMGIEPSLRHLYFHAEAHLRDPVMGITGLILHLQRQVQDLKAELKIAKRDYMMILEENHRHQHLMIRSPL